MKIRRPQNVPKVLQRKTAPPAAVTQTPRRPVVAPPVYRPQTTPRCLQLKKAPGAPPAKPAGPTVPPRGGRPAGVVQRMQSTPKSEIEIKEIKPELNGPFETLPTHLVGNILDRLDVRSASRFAQSQRLINPIYSSKRTFAATDWGTFWITEESYFQGIALQNSKRQKDTNFDKLPIEHRQKKIGVSMKLEFVAGPAVHADKIGLTQIVQHYLNGKPQTIDKYKQKMLVDAEEGYKAHIDVKEETVDPMYAWDPKQRVGVNQKVGTGNAKPFYGQWGSRQQPATLLDDPQDRGVLGPPTSKTNVPNSGQVFETTALALEGEQEGTYYGSVKWGWKTDAEGNFFVLPLTVVSRGSVSKTFAEAIETWNKFPNTSMYQNRKLPPPK